MRTEAAWGLARQDRSRVQLPRLASTDEVEQWLQSLNLDYNPFAWFTAEDEETHWPNGRHFIPHPAYDHLCNERHTALFAPPGGGKTTFRLRFKEALAEKSLVVEYTGFNALTTWDWSITPLTVVHIDHIVRRAATQLDLDPETEFAPHRYYGDHLKRLVEIAHARGHKGVHVLVDNVDAGHDAQQNPAVAERLVRHLLDNTALLTIPGLRFHFFLPEAVYAQTKDYASLSGGLIQTACVHWTPQHFQTLLKHRLSMAGNVDSLKALANTKAGWPDWDQSLAEMAGGSPRRLVQLVDLLFRHRAALWIDGQEQGIPAQIQPIDWLYLSDPVRVSF